MLRCKRWYLLFVVLMCSFLSVAKSPPLESFAKLPEKRLVVVSPSGSLLAFRKTTQNEDKVYVIDLKARSPLASVDVALVNPTKLFFVDDNTLILQVFNNIRFGKTRQKTSAAYAFNLKSKSLFPLLTPERGISGDQFHVGRIIGFDKSGKWAYMPAREGRDRGYYNLYKVKLTKKSRPKLFETGDEDTIDFFMDGDGKVIARVKFDQRFNKHQIEVKRGEKWHLIFEQETPYINKKTVGLSEDFKQLYLLGHDEKRRTVQTLNLNTGELSEPLYEPDSKDVSQVLVDRSRIVHGVIFDGFSESYDFFSKSLAKRFRSIEQALGNKNVQIASFSSDWKHFTLTTYGEQDAGSWWMFTNGKLMPMGTKRSGMAGFNLPQPQTITVNARDGLEIPTLITVPDVPVQKSLPAIMLPHGGPESHDTAEFDWLAQFFVSKGMVVIQPQFRGSTGFGIQHVLAGRGEWGKKMQDDLTDVLDHLVKKRLVDKNKVCIAGGSYGGYAALSAATKSPNLYKCIISINGISDLDRLLMIGKRKLGRHHAIYKYWNDVIDTEKNKDVLETLSPINYAEEVKSPVLLIHGKHDDVVSSAQSESMFDELEDADKSVIYIELEEEGHHLLKANSREKVLRAIDDFIREHI